MTIEELMDFVNANKIPMNTEILAAGASVRFIGYEKNCNLLTIDDEVQNADDFSVSEIIGKEE